MRSTAKAFAINAHGTVGIQYSPDGFQIPELALWSRSAGTQLSGILSDPCGVTDSDDILSPGDVAGPFLWNPDYRSANVTDLIEPGSPDVSQLYLCTFASNGVLAGQAFFEGVFEAVVLTPAR